MPIEKTPYLFASSSLWTARGMQGVQALFLLAEKFSVVTTDVQIEHLKNVLFSHNMVDMAILDEAPSPDEMSYIKNQNPDFYKNYTFFKLGLDRSVHTLLPIDMEELELKLSERLEEKLPPMFTGNNEADIVSWLGIINSPKIPLGSDIFIYAAGDDFLYQKNIHPYLAHEWKRFKRGTILPYDPSMFTQRISKNSPEDITPAKKNPANAPAYLQARFIAVMDELQRNLAKDILDGAPELLSEAQEYLQKIEGKVPVDTLNGMKRLYAGTVHKVKLAQEKK